MRPTLHAPSDALARLLDDSLAFAPTFGIGLSSHLPMALAALDALGAGAPRMTAFFDAYVAEAPLSRAPALQAAGIDEGADWRLWRGHAAAFPALRRAFATALARNGRDAVLRAALPWLVSGIGGAAFHGVIRTAHAVESAHEAELAAALAHWASRWMPLDPPPASDAAALDEPADWLGQLETQVDAGWRPQGRLIADGLVDASRTRAYAALAGRSGIERDPARWLAQMGEPLAQCYAATRDFTVLHLCTSRRALAVLLPWLSDGALLAPVAHAVAAARLATAAEARRNGARPAPAADASLDWPAVIERACASDNDHVIKLVHTLAAQAAADPRPVWLAAARVAVAPR